MAQSKRIISSYLFGNSFDLKSLILIFIHQFKEQLNFELHVENSQKNIVMNSVVK